MHSPAILAKKYVQYYLTASNGSGHGVHSPFVFEFIKFVLNDKKNYDCYQTVELVRKELLKNKTEIAIEDFGAGSSIINTKKRKINAIAASSLKPKKYSRLLFRIVQYYNLKQVLELGTSLGITTAYMAHANNNPVITSMEGSTQIAAIARQNFNKLHLKNTHIITGNFDETLLPFLREHTKTDLAFLDGNHRKVPTILYFEQILATAHNDTIFIFDDIYWSAEMEEAWEAIQQHPAVTLTINLFFIGIVFLRKDFKVKQHFSIRF